MANERVLVVEDEALSALDTMRVLKALGYRAMGPAATGHQAIEHAGEGRPELILMDVRLRGPMDGIEAAEQIRQRYHIPVIYTTAYSDEETWRRAKETSPLGYLLKPFDPMQLAAAIELYLGRHHAERALKESEQRFRAIFEQGGIGIVLMDAAGRLLQVNPAFVVMLGCAEESMRGRDLADLWIPEDRAIAADRLRTTLAGGNGGLNIIETRYRCLDGRTVWGRLTTSLIRGEDGTILYGLGMVEDVTEERTADEERERLLAELRSALVHVKTLRGMLPICASCKKIRDDKGYWTQVEAYLAKHTDAQFSHGLCPDCARHLYPEVFAGPDESE